MFRVNICKYSPWIVLTIVLYTSAFIYLFIENFIFSSSLDLTSVREIDDYAFQASLRRYHENRKFFALHDYAYGWIFWFPLVCITYPFYFLSIYFGIDTPLVVIPRQMSLFFTIGTAFILYKIASLYTKDNFTKSIILLLYLSFPATGYFSLRFGTVAQTMFLSSLAYYLVAKKEFLTQKDLCTIAMVVAAAAATKLSALLITPLITLVILDRLSWKIKENLVPLIKSFFVFLFSLAALSQIPPKAVIAQIKTTQTSYGDQKVYDSFFNGIVSPNLYIGIFLLTLLFLVGKTIIALRNDRNFYKRDYLYICLALVISITYLLLSIKMGTMYITIYFTVISFLLPLGILALEYISNIYLRYVVGSSFLVLSLFLNVHSIFSTELNHLSWNTYYVKADDPAIIRDLSIREVLKTKLKTPEEYTDKLKILKDYQVPSPYGIFSKNIFEVNIFDNVNLAPTVEYDLIGLYKKGVAFLTDSEFKDLINNVDSKIALQYKDHRKAVNNLLLKKQFNNVYYEVLLEDEDYVYYIPTSH